jgi:hypothetical protein
MRTLNRISPWLPFCLLLAGSIVFLNGGRSHPHTGAGMGPVGSPEYFFHFAQAISSTPGWVPMHVMILIGPVTWALATASIRAALPERGSSLWGTAQVALVISATLWAVTFIFDGLVAPVFARTIVAAGQVEPLMLASFRANQVTVITTGLISWILNGIAIVLFSIGLFAVQGRSYPRLAVGAIGILIGVWPIVAAITGEFIPGPFTSDLWKETALATAIWYVAFGVALARVPRAPRVAVSER